MNAREAIVLASTSPRRRRLLEEAGIRFEVEAPGVDETMREGESPRDFARRAAEEKAKSVAERLAARGRGPVGFY